MIKKFEMFNSGIYEKDFGYFNDTLVYIKSIRPFGEQYNVVYIDKKGFEYLYTCDDRDEIDMDFRNTEDSFVLSSEIKKKNPIPKPVKSVSKVNTERKYNVVYDLSKNKHNVLKRNLSYRDAIIHRNAIRKTSRVDSTMDERRINIKVIK
jgi:hypothetical protein